MMQMMLEDTFENIIVQHPNKENQRLFLLIENGVLEQKAYTTEREWAQVLVETEVTETQMLDRYDIVIHMVTAADGAADHFNHLNQA